MTADEMFKKLGYEKKIPDLWLSEAYYKENDRDYEKDGPIENIDFKLDNITISFNIWYSEVQIYYKLEDERRMETEVDLTIEELKAINKKCKELGWYD